MPDMSGDKKRPWWHWALVCAVTCAFIGLLVWGPWWIEGRHLKDTKGELVSSAGIIVTGFRTMLVAIAAGGFTAAGLWYTHKKHELEADSQVTERYVEAVKLLGSENLHERLGGIYSLERIMKDSERDHSTVVEVLSAFVRSKLTAVRNPATETAAGSGGRNPRFVVLRRISEEARAALTVLNRRTIAHRLEWRADLTGADLQTYELQEVDLRYCVLDRAHIAGSNLSEVSLSGGRLKKANLNQVSLLAARLDGAILDTALLREARLLRADLNNASLQGADLEGADLTDANMAGANLRGACLRDAKLPRANLRGANLEGADLKGANLEGVALDGANLDGANTVGALLKGANLQVAIGVTEYQLCHSYVYKSTLLPEAVARNRHVEIRITQCEESRAAPDEDQSGSLDFPPE